MDKPELTDRQINAIGKQVDALVVEICNMTADDDECLIAMRAARDFLDAEIESCAEVSG